MGMCEDLNTGNAWRAVARRNSLRVQLVDHSSLTVDLTVAGQGVEPPADVDEPPPADGDFAEAVDAIVGLVASRLFRAGDAEELEIAIEEVLEDAAYHEARTALLLRAGGSAPTPEEAEEPLQVLMPCAGIGNREVFDAAARILKAIATAQQECRALTMLALSQDSAAMDEVKKLAEAPVPSLLETRAMPAAMKQALYAGFSLDVLVFAVGAACDREVPANILREIVHRLFLDGRQFLRLLAGMPGVTPPLLLAAGETLDLEALMCEHARSERGYEDRLAKARSTKARVYPPRPLGDE